jgi:hypothetical protein
MHPWAPAREISFRVLARMGIHFDPDVVVQVPRMVDADAIIDKRAGIIYCSPRQLSFLNRQFGPAQ